MKRWSANLFRHFFETEKLGGLILLICTIISLLIANSESGHGYVEFMHRKIDLSIGSISLNYSVEHWVNDGLMAIFFLLVGLEVERELYVGELSEFKKAILPVVAAAGGVLVPALIHFFFNAGTETQSGFAIPMATDIAFALGVLGLAGKRVPLAVKVFLTALAIIDDIAAILVIAIFYTSTIYFSYLLAALGIAVVLFIMNRWRLAILSAYILPGIVMWYCLLKSGVHATIAGVLLAFLIPFIKKDDENISLQLQHFLHKPVAFIIVPIFALVNTAILLPADIGASLAASNSLGIILGLVIGKPVGIFMASFLLVKSRLATLQEGVTWKNLLGIGLLGGIGFTMSIFITNLAFDEAGLIVNSKMSILLGSAISAILGYSTFLFNNRTPRTT